MSLKYALTSRKVIFRQTKKNACGNAQTEHFNSSKKRRCLWQRANTTLGVAKKQKQNLFKLLKIAFKIDLLVVLCQKQPKTAKKRIFSI